MTTRVRAALLVSASGVAVAAGLIAGSSLIHRDSLPLPVELRPERLLADGSDAATLAIDADSPKPPRISFSDSEHGLVVENIRRDGARWQARVRSGVVPGRTELRVEAPGYQAAVAKLELALDARDSMGDGTPDFLRLDTAHDREQFRRWFTYLAEAQYFQPAAMRPPEINDCAALIRYAYREALHAHDDAWTSSANLQVIPAFDSVEKYQYPFTPLGAALFRVRAGAFTAGDTKDRTFLQFADAKTLCRFNTYCVSRDIRRAQPGDLFFFRQETNHVTYHSMIYLGESQLHKDGQRYVIYHTGPEGSNPGELRRLTVEQLLQFPQQEWRPLASNPNFLGVARWNILRTQAEEPDAGTN